MLADTGAELVVLVLEKSDGLLERFEEEFLANSGSLGVLSIALSEMMDCVWELYFLNIKCK